MDTDKSILHVSDIADILGVSVRTVQREINKGKLPATKFGRRYIVKREELNNFIKNAEHINIPEKVTGFLNDHKSEMISTLQQFISISSESHSDTLDDHAQLVAKIMRKHGIRTVIHGKDESVTVQGSFGYAKNGILFDCPLDTAPIGDIDKWSYPPFDGIIKNGRMYGRGTVDCKGGMVAMLYAVLALAEVIDEKSVRVELVFDGGEHSGDYTGMKSTINKGIPVTCGVIGYGGTGSNKLAIGCRGYHRYKLISKGSSVHTGARYKSGINAITNMAALINEMDHVRFPKSNNKYFEFGSKATFSQISGGYAINIVPDTCTAYLDVRTVPELTKEQVDRIIQKVIQSASLRHKGFSIRKEYLLGQEGYVLNKDERIVQTLADAITTVTKNTPGLIVHGPAHIGTLLHTHKIPIVVYGPNGGNIHSYDEYIELNSLPVTAEIYAHSVLNFFNLLN